MPGIATGTEAEAGTETGTGTVPGREAGTEAGADTETGTGTVPGIEAGTETGTCTQDGIDHAVLATALERQGNLAKAVASWASAVAFKPAPGTTALPGKHTYTHTHIYIVVDTLSFGE